jgi:hypothetical protein
VETNEWKIIISNKFMYSTHKLACLPVVRGLQVVSCHCWRMKIRAQIVKEAVRR